MPHSAPGLPTPARRRPPRAARRRLLAALLAGPALVRARPAPPALAEQLPRILAGCGLPATSLGLHVCEVDSGRPLAALHAEQAFVLASTAKIVTSLAALDLLGPQWRWRTHAFATGPVQRGRLLGDLLIVGGGDPSLTPSGLRDWLDGLHRGGLHDIGGDLVIDRSAFHLQPGDHAGTPEPAPDRPHHARPDGLVLDGAAPASAPARLAMRVPPGPPRLDATLAPDAAAQALLAAWHAVGGRLGGRVRLRDLSQGRADGQRLPVYGADGDPLPPLATRLSPPLAEVLRTINKTSHNVAARHLMLSLSRGFPAQPATLAAARERLRLWLQRQGLGPGDLTLDNGSGLSRAERGRPRALVQLLRRAWAVGEPRHFVDSLPVAGVDGTLAHRLQGGAAAGQAYLKTGTLLDARALAGYVRARSGRVHAVAVLVNHPEAGRATGAIDAVIEALARHG